MQVTLRGRSSGSYTVENLSLVQRDGATLNGVGPLTPVTFGGASSVTVPAGGTVTSDPISFSLTAGQDVFLTFWVPLGSAGVYRDGGTETAAWYVNGTDVSGVVDWTSLTLSGTKTHVYDAELVEVSPAPDTTAPVLNTATVNGTSLVLNYIEANGLDTGSTPATGDFSIGTDGAPQTVSAVVVTGNDVTLTLTPGVAPGDTVTVSYTAGTNPIQDVATNPAANLSGQAVTNTTAGSPVVAWTATGQIPTGTWKDSGFDDRTFRVLLDGAAITQSGGAVQVTLRGRSSGSYMVENLSLVSRVGTTLNGVGPLTPVTFGGASSVTVPAGGTVTSDPISFSLTVGQDVFLTFWVPPGSAGVYLDGGSPSSPDIATWFILGTDQSGVVDWTSLGISGTRPHVYDVELVEVLPGPDTTAPVLNTATVNGTSLVLNYIEANGLDTGSTPATGDFSIGTDGAPQTVSAVVVTANDVTLTLTPGVAEGDTVTVTYTAGAVGARIQDGATNPAANLSGQAVTNSTDTTAPVLNTATVNGTSLVLNYIEANGLDTGSTPATGDFSIGTDGAPQTVSAVVVTGNDVTLTLTPGVAPGDTVTVSYTAGTNPIQDVATNPAANLSGQAVTNTTAGSPVVAWTATGQIPTGTWKDSGFDDRTFRVLLDGAAITQSGGAVQVTLRGRSSGSYMVENLSLVSRVGTTLNGVGPLTPVTFGGASSVTVPAGGTVTSDPISFSLTVGQDVFLTFWVPPGSAGVYLDGGSPSSPDIATWFILGTDQSGVVDWTSLGISGTRPHVYDVELVEVLPGPDTTAPVLNTATVNGTSLVLNYIEANGLDTGSTPATGDFSIGTDGAPQTVSAVVVTANDVTLTLTPGVAEGDTVTVTYTAGAVGARIQDGATNPAANLSGQAVTNSTDTTAPVLNTATVNGTSLVLNYIEANGLDTGSTPATGDFSIGTDGAPQTVSAVVVTGNDVTLTLTPGVAPGDTVTVSYTAGTNPIQDVATNPAANLSGQAVTNTTAGSPVVAWTATGQIPTGTWKDSGFDDRTFRVLLDGAAITQSGGAVQVTLRGRSSGSYMVENLSLVSRVGTTLNGVGPLTPVTFGGASSVTVPAGGTVTSDPISFSLTVGQDVFLTFWVPPGSAGVYLDGGSPSSPDIATWFILGTDQSGVVDWTSLGISGTRPHVYDVELVEVLPGT